MTEEQDKLTPEEMNNLEKLIISAMTYDGESPVENVGDHAEQIAKVLVLNGYRPDVQLAKVQKASPDRPELKENFLSDLRLLEEHKTSPEWIATKYLALFDDARKPVWDARIGEARREGAKQERERIMVELDKCFELAPNDDNYFRLLVKSSLEYLKTGKRAVERQDLDRQALQLKEYVGFKEIFNSVGQ